MAKEEWFVAGHTYDKDVPSERSVILFQKDPIIGAVNFKIERIHESGKNPPAN